MYTVVVCVDNVHVPFVINGQAVWILELTIINPFCAPFTDEFPVLAEYLYPVVAPIRYKYSPCPIDGDTGWCVKLPIACAGGRFAALASAYLEDELAVSLEFEDPVV